MKLLLFAFFLVYCIYPSSVKAQTQLTEEDKIAIRDNAHDIIDEYFKLWRGCSFLLKQRKAEPFDDRKNDLTKNINDLVNPYFLGADAIFSNNAEVIIGCKSKKRKGNTNIISTSIGLKEYFRRGYLKSSEAATFEELCLVEIDEESFRIRVKFKSKFEVERTKCEINGFEPRVAYFGYTKNEGSYKLKLLEVRYEEGILNCIELNKEPPVVDTEHTPPFAVVSPTIPKDKTKKSLPPLIKILNTQKVSSDLYGSIKTLVKNVNLSNINVSENGRAVSYQFDSTSNVLNYDYNFRGDNDTIKFLISHKKLKSIADSITLTYHNPCVTCEGENDSLSLIIEKLESEIDSLNMIIAELRWRLEKKNFATKKLHDKLLEKEKRLAETEKDLEDKKMKLDTVTVELDSTRKSVGESAEKISTQLHKLEINITKTIEVYERYDHQKAFFIGLNYTLFNDPFSFKSSEANGLNIYNRVFQNNLGFSFYHNIGGFVSNVRFRSGNLPKNAYSLVDVQREKESLFSQDIEFNDVNFVSAAENISTVNAGIYFYPNILKGLYGAVGISRIKGEVWEYYDGDLGSGLSKEANDLYALNLRQLNLNGVYTGIAYVVPWFQVEMGYNWLYKDFNLSLGMNYPIGAIGKDKTNKIGQKIYKPRHIKVFNPKYKNVKDTTSNSLRYKNVLKKAKNLTYRKFQINKIILEGTKNERKDRDSVKLVIENILSFYANRDSFPIEWYKENNFDFYQKKMDKFLREQIIKFNLGKVITDSSIGSKAYRILDYLNLEDTGVKDKLIKLKRIRGAFEEVIFRETENIKKKATEKTSPQNKK